MQQTPHQFQIPAIEYTKDQLGSRATKATSTYDFWFENNFNLMHLLFTYIELNKTDF